MVNKSKGPRNWGSQKKHYLPFSLEEVRQRRPEHRPHLPAVSFRIIKFVRSLGVSRKGHLRNQFERSSQLRIDCDVNGEILRDYQERRGLPFWIGDPRESMGIWVSQAYLGRSSCLWFEDQWYIIEGITKCSVGGKLERGLFHLTPVELESGDDLLETAVSLMQKLRR